MSNEPPPLPPAGAGLPPPPAPISRAPLPGWMWLLFGLGPVLLGTVLALVFSGASGGDLPGVAAIGAVAGLSCALPLAGGLALAARFFSDPAARILGGLLFAGLLVVGLAAVGFAGCVCLEMSTRI